MIEPSRKKSIAACSLISARLTTIAKIISMLDHYSCFKCFGPEINLKNFTTATFDSRYFSVDIIDFVTVMMPAIDRNLNSLIGPHDSAKELQFCHSTAL